MCQNVINIQTTTQQKNSTSDNEIYVHKNRVTEKYEGKNIQ